MFRTRDLHFTINSAGYNIAGRQVFTRIVPVHNRVTVLIAQDTALGAFRFGDQK